MQEYIEKLHKELHEISKRPVCRGTVEEATEIVSLICMLRKIEYNSEFTEVDAYEWTEHMKNEDDTTGMHWPMSKTSAIMAAMKLHYDPAVWYAAMNMIYSDYCGVAEKHGVDTQDYYADMAEAFLNDKDAKGPEEKLSAYYHFVAS